jgi:hypothetical protein
MLPASSPIHELFTLQRRCNPFAKVGAVQMKGRLWLESNTWSQCAEAAPVGGNTQQMEIVGTERHDRNRNGFSDGGRTDAAGLLSPVGV